MTATNQQESLSITEQQKWFLAGFIEGEGSVCVSIKEHPTARFGYYVDPEFFLYQHRAYPQMLELTKRMFGSGRIFSKTGKSDSFGLCDCKPENAGGKSGSVPSRLHEFRASQTLVSRILRDRGSHGAQGTPNTTGNGAHRSESIRAKPGCERQGPKAILARSDWQNPQRLHAGLREVAGEDIVRTAWRHAD